MKKRFLTANAVMMALVLSLLSGCVFDLETSREPATQGGSTTASGITTAPRTGPSGTTGSGTTGSMTAPITATATKPVTKPVTKPATKPATKPSTKPPGGAYANISNERNEWSYGYPDSWVTDYSGYWKFGQGNLYLTMDLGYEMGYTDVILDILKAKGVKVTFFLTTEYIKEEPAYVKRMLAEGHQIGSHSTGHLNMVKLVGENGTNLIANMKQWEAAYKGLTGRTTDLYRAPEGVFSRRGLKVLEEMGYKNIFWGAAYSDYDEDNQPTVAQAKEKLYKFINSGDVVLLHPFKTNSELLPEFIDDMRAHGLDFAQIP